VFLTQIANIRSRTPSIAHGDMAYTVGYEHTRASVDGEPRPEHDVTPSRKPRDSAAEARSVGFRF
jgi:hypothetical protein